LHAERPAHSIGHDPYLVATSAEHLGDVVAKTEHALATDIEGPMLPLGIVFGERGARLHRTDDDTVVAQPKPRNVRRRGKGGVDLCTVAKVKVEPDIVGNVVIELRRIRGVG